jgi:hypothetical protein
MKMAHCLAAAWISTMALTTLACADQKPFVKGETQQVSATVESIDLATRVVELRGPNGPMSVVAGPEVRNLPAVHVGDKVTLSYYLGLIANINKSAASVASDKETASGWKAQAGAKPGGAVARVIISTVRIESVDTSSDTVTFRRADGGPRTVAVESADGKAFIRTLKPGDLVDVTYTEAVAVSVVPGS